MTIKNKFEIEEFVYMSSDTDQRKCQVVSITITKVGLMYTVSVDGGAIECYEFELTKDKGVI